MKKYNPTCWEYITPQEAGKETEIMVQDVFKKWNSRTDFAWHRMPDSRASRGRLPAQPADYLYRCGMNSGFIEVKAIDHPFRLTRARLTQLPVLRKWTMAGGNDLVLVHHYRKQTWRLVAVGDLDPSLPSWDLRPYGEFTDPETALKALGLF